MKIVNHKLPKEGIKIAGIHFKPGEAKEVKKEVAEQLVKRKGFKTAATGQGTDVSDKKNLKSGNQVTGRGGEG